MATPTDNFKRNKAYSHGFSKVQTEITQNLFESDLKASHNVPAKDVLIDTITYCPDVASADAFVLANPTVLMKHVNVPMTVKPGTNGQTWYVDIAGQFIRPWITPTDIPDLITNLPSFGLDVRLETGGGAFISPSSGVWNIDGYAGTIIFDLGQTPADNGWGTPHITFFSYIGKTLADTSLVNGAVVGKSMVFTQADLAGGRLNFSHNLGAKDSITTVTIKDDSNKEIEPDDILHISENVVSVDFRMAEPIPSAWTILVTCLQDTVIVPPVFMNRFLNGPAINTLTLN